MKKTWLLAGAVLLLLVFVLTGFLYYLSQPASVPQVADRAPNFSATAVDGSEVDLRSMRGNVVILNFWASWCAPCAHELGSLSFMYENMSHEPLRIIGVNLDQEGAAVARHYAELHKLRFTVVADPQSEIRNLYRPVTLPQTIIIDADGVIRHVINGARDWTSEVNVQRVFDLLPREGVAAR